MAIHAHITGRLGRDAERRTTQMGDSLCAFALATDSGFGDRKTTHWIDCTLWGKRADALLQYLKKGSQVVVHGELTTRDYQGRDGTPKTALSLRVAEIDLVGSRQEGTHSPAPAYHTEAPADDTIPF